MDERKKRLTLKMVDSKRVLCEIFSTDWAEPNFDGFRRTATVQSGRRSGK